MEILARIIWNPFLCLLYLFLGFIFLCITDLLAWKKGFKVFIKIIFNDTSRYSGRLISHSKAFFAMLSTTVGIGNLAGVGTAIHLGGPGALFWMWMSALFGMSFRLASTYLVVKYRPSNTNSVSFATPMAYFEKYLRGKWRIIITLIAGLILTQGVILSNLVQSNSLAHAVHNRYQIPNFIIAGVLTFFVALVILGGVRKIVDFTSVVTPWIMVFYVLSGLFILCSHPLVTLESLRKVFYYAFTPYAMTGGVAGYAVFQAMQFGVSRGIFSHMSGLGTSTFFQGANEDPPEMGAFMSTITPFVDTVIICSITGLVILSAPYWQDHTGAFLTLNSFQLQLGVIGDVVVIVSLMFFAFTTILGFAHISERCFVYLGGKNVFKYRLIFLAVTFAGPFLNLIFIWSLSDIIIGLIIIFHLFPLLFITLINLPTMLKDLKGVPGTRP